MSEWVRGELALRLTWAGDSYGVPAWLYGAFAIHGHAPPALWKLYPEQANRWILTHVPSGLPFAAAADAEELQWIAEALLHPDWKERTGGTPAMAAELRGLLDTADPGQISIKMEAGRFWCSSGQPAVQP